MTKPFWEAKNLAEMTREEWEQLCDGCGRCCLIKFQGPRGRAVQYTDVACRLLDTESGRCTRYDQRGYLVRDCLVLTPEKLDRIPWLPESCAYLRLSEGRGLAAWHPLVSGDRDSVRRAGISVAGRVVSERHVHPAEVETRVVRWVHEDRD